jgi:hypothetical protein
MAYAYTELIGDNYNFQIRGHLLHGCFSSNYGATNNQATYADITV